MGSESNLPLPHPNVTSWRALTPPVHIQAYSLFISCLLGSFSLCSWLYIWICIFFEFCPFLHSLLSVFYSHIPSGCHANIYLSFVVARRTRFQYESLSMAGCTIISKMAAGCRCIMRGKRFGFKLGLPVCVVRGGMIGTGRLPSFLACSSESFSWGDRRLAWT